MIFIKEDDAICLNDGENIVVFPLIFDEIDLLKNDIIYFENYINLKVDALDILYDNNLKFSSLLNSTNRSEFPLKTLWVVVSILDKSIVGFMSFENYNKENKSIEVNFAISKNYRRRGYASTAISLICDWLFDNNIDVIFANVEKRNELANKVLINNNFKVCKKGDLFIYKKDKL